MWWFCMTEKSFEQQTGINLTENQMNELIVKGETFNKLKITALYPTDLFDKSFAERFKQEHILLWEYKQRVREAIDKLLKREMQVHYQKEVPYGETTIRILEELKRRLGL